MLRAIAPTDAETSSDALKLAVCLPKGRLLHRGSEAGLCDGLTDSHGLAKSLQENSLHGCVLFSAFAPAAPSDRKYATTARASAAEKRHRGIGGFGSLPFSLPVIRKVTTSWSFQPARRAISGAVLAQGIG